MVSNLVHYENLEGHNHSWNMFMYIVDRDPPKFSGNEDPIELEKWIGEFDKLFTVLEYPNELRVKHATFFLREQANFWWRENKETLTAQPSFGWEGLKKAMWDRFYPPYLEMQKTSEFLRLEMGDMTVKEYYTKFVELMRLVPDLVPTDKMKALKFELGLTSDIQLRLRGEISYPSLDVIYWEARKACRDDGLGCEGINSDLRDTFCPRDVEKRNMFEFLNLEMGDMTVEEYYNKFVDLMHLVPDMVHTDKMKALKFELGLSTDIRIILCRGKFSPSLDVIYREARRVEELLRRIYVENGDEEISDTNGSDWQGRVHKCNKCTRNHPGKDCEGKLVRCHGCGKLGHREYECWAPGNRYGNDMPKRFNRSHLRNVKAGQMNQDNDNGCRTYQYQQKPQIWNGSLKASHQRQGSSKRRKIS